MSMHFTLAGLDRISEQFPAMIETVVAAALKRGRTNPECEIRHIALDNGESRELFAWVIQNQPTGSEHACVVSLNTSTGPWNIYLDEEDFNEGFVLPPSFLEGSSRSLSVTIAEGMAYRWYGHNLSDKVRRLCEEGEFTEAFAEIHDGISGGYDANGYTITVYSPEHKLQVNDIHYCICPDLEKNREAFYRYLERAAVLALIGNYNQNLVEKWSAPLLFS